MCWRLRPGCALCLLGMLALSAGAQPPEGGGGGRRGPMGGGFGGFGLDRMLQNTSLQKELNLTDDQIKKAKEVAEQIRSKHKEEFDSLEKLDREERREKAMELGRTVSAETKKALADVLKPEQSKRLNQILLQMRGLEAFNEPDVQSALKLSDEQKDQLKTIASDARKEMQELRAGRQGGDQGNREEMRKKFQAMRAEHMDKAKAVLNDTQKKEWQDMLGAPFHMQFEGGRRRGGG